MNPNHLSLHTNTYSSKLNDMLSPKYTYLSYTSASKAPDRVPFYTPMLYLLCSAIICFFCLQSVYAQPSLAPIQYNTDIASSNLVQAKQAFTDITQLTLLEGESATYCIPVTLLSANFLRMEIDNINSSIFAGAATVRDSCLTYEAFPSGQSSVDSIQLVVTDANQTNYRFLVIVNVRILENLPFVDDFSYPGPYPNPNFWVDRNVFINTGLAKDPLSIGVATFDGVDENGTPYGGREGRSDFLTSTFFNLSQTSSPVLSFYYQARGQGFISFPRERDSLVIECKNDEGAWKTVASFPGIGSLDTTPDFTYHQILLGEEFRHSAFQFRFVNRSRRDGILGIWHIDYVQLADDANASASIPDIAFYQAPSALLKEYTALPSSQFATFENTFTSEEIEIGLGSYFLTNGTVPISSVRAVDRRSGATLFSETLLEVPPVVSENQRDLAPGRYKFTNAIRSRTNLINALQSLAIEPDDSISWEIIYTMQPNNQGMAKSYRRNDTVRTITHINDYLAYDDGTSEAGIFIAGGSVFDIIVQEYELLRGDTLKGIRMFFPYVFNQGNRQRFELLVYDESLDDPIYSKIYDRQIFPDQFDQAFGSFTNFALQTSNGADTSIYLPEGKFYVGWRQISSNTSAGLYVGFDKSRPDISSKIFYNESGSWQAVNPSSIPGAIMIRPVFGPKTQVPTNAARSGNIPRIAVFPNPTKDFLTIPGDSYHQIQRVQILSLSGKLIFEAPFQHQLDVSQLTPGSYFLILLDKQGMHQAVAKWTKQ